MIHLFEARVCPLILTPKGTKTKPDFGPNRTETLRWAIILTAVFREECVPRTSSKLYQYQESS